MNKLQKFLCRHSQASIALWVVVGGYLVYLAWQLLTGPTEGANPVVTTVFGVLFAIVGAAIAVIGLYAVFAGYNKERQGIVGTRKDEDEDGEEG